MSLTRLLAILTFCAPLARAQTGLIKLSPAKKYTILRDLRTDKACIDRPFEGLEFPPCDDAQFATIRELEAHARPQTAFTGEVIGYYLACSAIDAVALAAGPPSSVTTFEQQIAKGAFSVLGTAAAMSMCAPVTAVNYALYYVAKRVRGPQDLNATPEGSGGVPPPEAAQP